MIWRKKPMPPKWDLRSFSHILLHAVAQPEHFIRPDLRKVNISLRLLEDAIISSQIQPTFFFFFFNNCEYIWMCQICTIRKWLYGMYVLAQKYFLIPQIKICHPEQHIKPWRCFSGAYLSTGKLWEQTAASMNFVLCSNDFTSKE